MRCFKKEIANYNQQLDIITERLNLTHHEFEMCIFSNT